MFDALGEDFNLADGMTSISGQIRTVLPGTIAFEIVNDLVPGEVESFVLELTNAKVIAFETSLEVLIANSLTVDIVDDDGR